LFKNVRLMGQFAAVLGIELALLASIVLAGSSFPRAIRLQKPLPIALSALAATGLYNFGTAFANRR
jgi:uncharacterized membrane protein (UPF0136 family)